MSHYAKVENGKVVQVIVAEQDVIDSGVFGTGWIQTSYNTVNGRHPEMRPLRKNFASVGYLYDSLRDAFIPPKTYPSWILNDDTCQWEPPWPPPVTDDPNVNYVWDEEQRNWVTV